MYLFPCKEWLDGARKSVDLIPSGASKEIQSSDGKNRSKSLKRSESIRLQSAELFSNWTSKFFFLHKFPKIFRKILRNFCSYWRRSWRRNRFKCLPLHTWGLGRFGKNRIERIDAESQQIWKRKGIGKFARTFESLFRVLFAKFILRILNDLCKHLLSA